jgi:hypothetical protein
MWLVAFVIREYAISRPSSGHSRYWRNSLPSVVDERVQRHLCLLPRISAPDRREPSSVGGRRVRDATAWVPQLVGDLLSIPANADIPCRRLNH